MSFETTIGGDEYGSRLPRVSDDEILGEIPAPPTFDEPLENVRARIGVMIGRSAMVLQDLDEAPPAVRKLLTRDANRKSAAAGQAYVSSWNEPIYDSPLQQRRLRLVSSILATAAKCGCRARPWSHGDGGTPVDDFTVSVGERYIRLTVRLAEVERKEVAQSRKGRVSATVLRVEVDGGAITWENVNPANRAVVKEIATAIVLKAEEELRARSVAAHQRHIIEKAALIGRRRLQAEEAARREQERLAELERQRVKRLLNEAEALRQARAIRSYVQEVKSSGPLVPVEELDAWASWALEQADKVDPVRSGAFLRSLAERE